MPHGNWAAWLLSHMVAGPLDYWNLCWDNLLLCNTEHQRYINTVIIGLGPITKDSKFWRRHVKAQWPAP